MNTRKSISGSFKIFTVLVLWVMWSCGPSQTSQEVTSDTSKPAVVTGFLDHLKMLCEKELSGYFAEYLHHPENVGKKIVLHVEGCRENEVRLRFESHSQQMTTLVLTQMQQELLLKHDVRLADLAPAEMTMYGGFADTTGSLVRQNFPVHNFGHGMWPGYEDFSWEIRFDPETGLLEYFERQDDVIKKHIKVQKDLS